MRLSAFGAERHDAAVFMREHTVTEQQIIASGIPYTFLRPNSYMSNFLTFYRPDQEGNIRLPLGNVGVSLIDPRDVADVAAHVLTTDGHIGKAYTLTGPEAITVGQIATAISEATGNGVKYIDTPEEAMRQGMLAHGMPPMMVDAILDLFATQRAGKMAIVTQTVRELTGRPARTFKEFARDHAQGWRTTDQTTARVR